MPAAGPCAKAIPDFVWSYAGLSWRTHCFPGDDPLCHVGSSRRAVQLLAHQRSLHIQSMRGDGCSSLDFHRCLAESEPDQLKI